MARAPVIVMRHPSTAFYRSAADEHVGRHSVLDSRGVDERLVCRTCLPQSLCRIVELAAVKIITTDHCNDLAGLRIKRYERRLNFRNLRKLDLKDLIFVINFLNQELGKKTRFQFFTRPLSAAAHIRRTHDGFKFTEAHADLIGRGTRFYYEALYILAFIVIVAIPIGMLVRSEFILDLLGVRQRQIFGVDENVL